jgi:hypothetical protein
MAICQYHCEAKGVSPDLYLFLSFTKANDMFPLLCKLFSMEEKYQQLGESFFNKPFKYLAIASNIKSCVNVYSVSNLVK